MSTIAEPTGLTIAEVAERTGTTPHTLRYYERIGLVDVPRDAAGHRLYDDAAVGRVTFITCLRLTQMPIREIARYIDLVHGGPATEPERLALLEAHRAATARRIEALAGALDVIDFKITTYGGAMGS